MRSPTTVWNSATDPGVADPPLPSSTGVFFFEQPAMARNAMHSTASLNPETNLSIVPTPCTRGNFGRPEWKGSQRPVRGLLFPQNRAIGWRFASLSPPASSYAAHPRLFQQG